MENNIDKYVEQEDGRYFEERLIITDDVDLNSRWTLQSMLAWMQEVAESHSRVYDYGFEDLRAKNACWVCLRYHLKLESYPRLYDGFKLIPGLSRHDSAYIPGCFHWKMNPDLP